MAEGDVKVLFMPSGRRGFFPRGIPLLDAARSLGVDIDSVCGGRGLCGRCQISCVTGSFAKHQIESDVDHLSPFSATEEKEKMVEVQKNSGTTFPGSTYERRSKWMNIRKYPNLCSVLYFLILVL